MQSFFFRKLQFITVSYFNSQVLYELKHKVRLSKKIKTCVRFYTFDSVSFLLKFSFSFQKKDMDSLTPKRRNSFQKQNNGKVTGHTFFCSQIWFLSCSKTFENSLISVWAGALQKLTWRGIFKTWKIKVLRTPVSLNRNYLVNNWNSFDY